MPEYSNRSNDPRITGAMKGMTPSDYDFALEVARQPASTAWEKKMQKKAANYARAFESRFPKKAFEWSNRNPLSAGGKGAYKDPEKVNMMTKDPFAKKPSTASKAAGAAGKVAGKAAGLAKSKVKADVKVAKKVAGVAGKVAGKAAGVAKAGAKALAKQPRPTRQVGKAVPTKKLMSNKNLKKK